MNALTTHVLDTSLGRPAAGVAVVLSQFRSGKWIATGRAKTDSEGRCRDLLGGKPLTRGAYRLAFEVGNYFKKSGRKAFYPSIVVEFLVADARHHHVPLLLSPWGYSTYRGS